MKRGFTLVELSIVLVIIGLLIGGILVAQSMIGTARVQAFVRQMQQYDIALTTHITKFKTLPGDDDLYLTASRTAFSPPSNAAKNDGQITDDDDNHNNTNAATQENRIYFPELRVLDGLIIENCPQIDIGTSEIVLVNGNNCNNPLGKLGKNNDIFVFSNHWDATYSGNYYFFTDCSAMVDGFYQHVPDVGLGVGCRMPFTAAEALAYDVKIDDGIANSGKVLGFYNTPFQSMFFSPSATAAYNISTSGLTYNMVQKIAPDMLP